MLDSFMSDAGNVEGGNDWDWVSGWDNWIIKMYGGQCDVGSMCN